MFYIVYKTTNKVNSKFYIGIHKTVDLNDEYLGSGKYLNYAIEKYGLENFNKEILYVFDNQEEMFAKEAEIVTEDFINENNTYNLKKGGFGGFDYINRNKIGGFVGKKHSTESREKISTKMRGRVLGEMSLVHREKISKSKLGTVYNSRPSKSFEHKEKLRKANLNKKHDLMACPQCGKIGGKRAIKRWHKICAGVTQW